jgi:hypothetical protein
MVTGTVTNAGGYETGVTVNGVVAIVYGNQFIVNHVPLQDGSNTITANAADPYGTTSTTSVTVTAATTGNYIRLTADTTFGAAPLEATLRIDGSFTISNSTISVIGPVQPEFLSSSAAEYKVRMTVAGVYYFTATVIGPDGNQYQDTCAITVTTLSATDDMFRSIWTAMTNRLMAGDTATALTYISSATQATYQQMFSALSTQLPAITATQTGFNFLYVRDGQAKYELVTSENGKTYSYEVIFATDANGLWKIQEF